MYYKRILTFMFPELYSPNEPVYFLGYFPDPHLSMDPDPGCISLCGSGSGSETLVSSIKQCGSTGSNLCQDNVHILKVFIDVDYHQRDLVFFIMQSCFHADCEQPKWKYCTVCVTMFAQLRKPLKWLNNKQHKRKPM